MAASDALQREPRTTTSPMGLNRLGCVLGTSRKIAATGLPHRRGQPIQLYQAKQEPLHGRPAVAVVLANSSWRKHRPQADTISLKSAVNSARVPLIWNVPVKRSSVCRASRKAALTRRRARLRSTALPNRRPKAYATCGCGVARGRNVIRTGPLVARKPFERSSPKTLRLLTRQITHLGVDGPWNDEPGARPGRHEMQTAHGIRACWPASGYLAETYASQKFSPSSGWAAPSCTSPTNL